MTAYMATPFGTRPSLLPGVIGYSYGTFNTHDPGTRMLVSNVALTSNVATLTVQIVEGFVPLVGGLISVQGTQNTSGLFNVSNVALASVSINSTTGAGTVTFALTHANVGSAADAGAAIVPPAPVLDTLPSSATAGQQFAVGSSRLATDAQRGITWFTQYTGSPSTVTMNLQAADVDQDAEYTTIDSSTNASGESRSLSNVNFNFYRIQAASTGGTTPKCAAGIMVR